MDDLSFRCPKTNMPINTRLDAGYKKLASMWHETVEVHCPHCGEDHPIKVRDAFLASALSTDPSGGFSLGASDKEIESLAERMTNTEGRGKGAASPDRAAKKK